MELNLHSSNIVCNLLQNFECNLPSPLNVFEMVITPELEYPLICVGIKKPIGPIRKSMNLKLEFINVNTGACWFFDETTESDHAGLYSLIIIIKIQFF